MHSGLRLLLVLVPFAILVTVVLPPASGQAYPNYTLGDFWDYTVEARFDTLLGIGNVSGDLAASGEARAEVTAIVGTEVTISWTGDLDLQGRFTLPGESTEAAISGTIGTTYEERRQEPQFLPLSFAAQTAFDVSISFLVTIPYTATLDVNATVRPTASSPRYPLEVGERTFTTDATLASNVTAEFLGMEFRNATQEEVSSTIRWNVTPSETVQVPAGSFSGLRVQMEALAGFVPSPFPALIPGGMQVTHHSPEVGSPVLFRFFGNGTEVGNASLETFSYASTEPPPFWQNPFFLGGLLAIPVAFLLYRYWRERRRGL